MSRLRKPNPGKLGKHDDSPAYRSKRVSFSLEYMTANNHYNFNYFTKKMQREELVARKALWQLLSVLSVSTWLDVTRRSRDELGGREKLPANQIKLSPQGYTLSDDDDVLVFRFGSNNFRLLGLRLHDDAVLHIIGFDFDFSAYDH